jgi:hypothetical protein
MIRPILACGAFLLFTACTSTPRPAENWISFATLEPGLPTNRYLACTPSICEAAGNTGNALDFAYPATDVAAALIRLQPGAEQRELPNGDIQLRYVAITPIARFRDDADVLMPPERSGHVTGGRVFARPHRDVSDLGQNKSRVETPLRNSWRPNWHVPGRRPQARFSTLTHEQEAGPRRRSWRARWTPTMPAPRLACRAPGKRNPAMKAPTMPTAIFPTMPKAEPPRTISPASQPATAADQQKNDKPFKGHLVSPHGFPAPGTGRPVKRTTLRTGIRSPSQGRSSHPPSVTFLRMTCKERRLMHIHLCE